MLFHEGANFEQRRAHADADSFGFLRTSDHAPIVVGQDHHRQAFQIGAKQPLT